MGGNSEVILSHPTNQLHFHKQLLQNFTLGRNIMIHDTTTISSKSGCGLINAESLLGGDTASLHIKTITTDHGGWGEWTKMYDQRWITGSCKMQISVIWTMWSSVPKQIRAMSASNLLPVEDASSLLKTLLPWCPIVFGTPLKSLVLISPSVRPSVRLSVHPVMREFKVRRWVTDFNRT